MYSPMWVLPCLAPVRSIRSRGGSWCRPCRQIKLSKTKEWHQDFAWECTKTHMSMRKHVSIVHSTLTKPSASTLVLCSMQPVFAHLSRAGVLMSVMHAISANYRQVQIASWGIWAVLIPAQWHLSGGFLPPWRKTELQWPTLPDHRLTMRHRDVWVFPVSLASHLFTWFPSFMLLVRHLQLMSLNKLVIM